MLRQFFKYFKFSRTEQNGFFVLSILMLFLFSFPFIANFFSKPDLNLENYNIQAFTSVENDTTDVGQSNEYRSLGDHKDKDPYDKGGEGSLFRFDPNRLDKAGWIKLGLKEKQVQVILNYRKKGGRFYKKEDLAKIYSISPATFKQLENYIEIAPTTVKNQVQNRGKDSLAQFKNDSENKLKTREIDINNADTTAFIALKGIGSTFAKRIVKYRESLGGFVSVDQIKEIYGLPVETFDAILPFLKISPHHAVSKLTINELDVKSLSKHPYISFKQSTAIVNYRNQHGHFRNLEDLKKVILLDDDFLRKLAPYLIF
ncbi:competence protein ComEA [Sphingobacterium kitahiroshimense]|uniref:ComEA family DNA-binding protein n=1 Tax=Sphingobacterium sp. B16(2022) TaxID=2914044 RepID=UPI00143C435A|nr:helix-hairpin-helix domain-containing protein [Sphingobacterium sp. B16(2022)]NJI71673.1 competence protein ComEA [Sphingobacterium sp. B16(2022)]